MEKKNKRANKNKGPNYYKGKNNMNTSKNRFNNNNHNHNNNNKHNKPVAKENIIVNEEKIDELEKFKFYENTMAINLEGHIDVNDDIVEDYAEVPEMIDVKEDSLDIMKNERNSEKVDAFVNPVDSVNVEREVNNDDIVEVIDVEDHLTDNDNLIDYDDIIAPDVEFIRDEVIEEKEFNNDVLDIDEINYSDKVEDEAIPEMTSFEREVEPVREERTVEKVTESASDRMPFVRDPEPVKNTQVKVDNVDTGKGGKYYNFETRVVFMVFIAIVLFAVSTVFIYQAITYTDIEDIVFSESSTINYSVCLNDNDYYNGECLGEDMQYISTLTKSVPIVFNYDLRYSNDVTYDVEYYVLGKTIIYDRDDASKILYRDDKILKERTTIKGTDSFVRVSGKVDVAFKERNDYVNGYKSKYALNSLASYEVILYVDDGNGPREVASLTIPLSTQTFSITEETLMRDNQRMTMKKVGLDSINTVFALVGVAFLIGGLIIVVRLFILVYKTLGGNASTYQKKLNQILTEYDRVIVISKSEYVIDPEKQFIKVDSFYELLDARDTLEKPIIYERVNSVKSFFYVEDNDKIYRYAMKESDFEKK